MIPGYTKNLSVQILIDLLQKHGIKRVVTSPGGTDLEILAGLQYNGNFELHSSIDERSAAYMACGIAEETNEPVVIVCTESTASRNYFPGLTEAYYRKLPVIAVTGVHRYSQIGHLQPQIIDRSISPNDLVVCKSHLPIIKDEEDVKYTELLVNKAILATKGTNPGPVHIDLPCCNYEYDFSCQELYNSRKIDRYEPEDVFPDLPKGRIAVFIGSHRDFTVDETKYIDNFCASHNAVVFCDHSSGYHGKYAFYSGLVSLQNVRYDIMDNIECLIHIGESMSDWPTMTKLSKLVKSVWRVSPDGELRDAFGKLTCVFRMTAEKFFKHYIIEGKYDDSYLKECLEIKKRLTISSELLPLSNVYTAFKLSDKLPSGSVFHIGASNTLRSWALFDLPEGVRSYANVGCRGIDGVLSSVVGASLSDKKHLHFCAVGDLMFYYDMNSLGNRDISGNLRILLINNNGGGIFKLKSAPGHKFFGDEATDEYIAAADHFGKGEGDLIKNFVENLGFKYISAKSKEEFDSVYLEFVSAEDTDKPVFFEVFTKDYDDREAFNIMSSIEQEAGSAVKNAAKQILGEKGTGFVKKIIGRK
ncbi:MAG: thiamine pyrophosphate-binding protein [Oscillospiraceae bacterium]|nr:thiamine pyrophosphate-binding protein [Oscillospiraceae bacterium]